MASSAAASFKCIGQMQQDQEEDWFANNCKSALDDYDGCGGGLAPRKLAAKKEA